MADAKKRIPPVEKGITPKGVLVFPYLNKPDTKFKKEGAYRARLKLEGEDAQAFLAKMEAAYTKAIDLAVEELKSKAKTPALAKSITVKSIKKASDKPWKPEIDPETGDETGAILFNFGKKASFVNKEGETVELRVDLFDAAKKPFPRKTMIYGGSTAKIAYEAHYFYTPALGAGLTLRLNGAQIIELRTGGAKDADAYGFGEEGEGLGDPQSSESSGAESGSESGGEPTDF